MQPSHNVEVVHQSILGLLAELPPEFRVVHQSESLAIWSDGLHHGGAVAGPMDVQVMNTIAGKYGFGLREAWKDDAAGVYILSLCELEGRDLK